MNKHFSRLRVFFAWLLLVLLPTSIAVWGVFHGWQRLRRQHLRLTQMRLAEISRRILDRSESEWSVREVFETPTNLRRSLVTVPPATASDHALLQEIRAYLCTGILPDAEKLRAWKMRFGLGLDPITIKGNPDQPIAVRWGKEEAWLIWSAAAPVRLCLMQTPPMEQRLASALREIAAGLPEKTTRISMIDRRTRRWTAHRNPDMKRLTRCWQERIQGNPPERVFDGHSCHLTSLGGELLLYLEQPLPNWVVAPEQRLIWFLMLTLAVGTLCFSLLWRHRRGQSLVFRLGGMFSFIIFLPLAGVWTLAMGVMADREDIRREQRLQAGRSELLKFDGGYIEENVRTFSAFQNLLSVARHAAKQPELLEKAVQDALHKHLLERIEIRNWQLELLLFREIGMSDPGFDYMSNSIGEYAFSRYHPDLAEERKNPNILLLTDILESHLFGLSEIANKPGELLRFRFNKSFRFWFWEMARDRTSPFAYINIIRSREQAIYTYLSRHTVENREIAIVARMRASDRWFGLEHPPQTLRELTTAVSRTNLPQEATLHFRGQSCLVLALPGNALEAVDLAAIIPVGAWERESKSLQNMVVGGFLLAMVVGGLCAWLLTKILVTPLSELSAGIEALRRHDHQYRIPVQQHDELGRTAAAFNHMLENLGEATAAREIQQTFLPQQVTPPQGYAVAWTNVMCAAMGGDYLDFITFSPTCFGLLIADVAGHGVNAGLVMAMAKAAVAVHIRAGGQAEDMLTVINSILFKITSRKKMMSCVLTLLDPHQHRLRLAIAGHPYPIWVHRADATVERVGIPGYPIGARRHFQVNFLELQLAQGDKLLLYSDGIVECLNRDGRVLDYDGVERLLRDHPQDSAQACVDRLLQAYHAWIADAPSTDDVSLLVLERLPEESSS